jgi:hypothetical protein
MKNDKSLNKAGYVLRFDSEKTPGVFNEIVIDTFDKAFQTALSLGDNVTLREMELRLEDYKAQLRNAQNARKISGNKVERSTYEELEDQHNREVAL